MTLRATLDLLSPDGRRVGVLSIACLRGERNERWRSLDALVDRRAESGFVGPAAPVQLLEEMNYGYEVKELGDRHVERLEPEDLFSSGSDIAEGRLEVRRATGTLTITVAFQDGTRATCDVEVRSRKLGYETEYRNMLQRIARESAELVQSAFAPSSLPAFSPDTLHDPATIYQRFAFVQALLTSETVRDALHLRQRQPHFEHATTENSIDPSRSTRSSASLARQLTAAGPRRSITPTIAGLDTLPRRVSEWTNESTFDTVPNRFIKYVLTRWRSIASDVERAMAGNTPNERRGTREALAVIDDLELALSSPAIRDAGRLHAFPHSNQVLQGRAGYRDLFEAFLLAESAATISWDDSSRLFKAGQRNVAELYEYWVFLELVRIVASLPGFSIDKRNLVKQSKDGISLELRREAEPVVVATGNRRGTPVEVRVWFNKTFRKFAAREEEASWTVAMRPDCSIHISPKDRSMAADTWVHFDAKYRIHELNEALDEATDENAPVTAADQRPISGDLAKMHAYRDAIRRTAGAYVLYPGGDHMDPVRHQQYHEILPGLGAFTLRPTADGESSPAASHELGIFLEQVIDHVAAQGTSAERARFWSSSTYMGAAPERLDHDDRLAKPPADTRVLLGFVRSPEHLNWILTSGLYNLRADPERAGSVGVGAPELGAEFAILYDDSGKQTRMIPTTGAVTVKSALDLLALGYQSPGGNHYLCLGLDTLHVRVEPNGDEVRAKARLTRQRSEWASPLVATWAEIFGS